MIYKGKTNSGKTFILIVHRVSALENAVCILEDFHQITETESKSMDPFSTDYEMAECKNNQNFWGLRNIFNHPCSSALNLKMKNVLCESKISQQFITIIRNLSKTTLSNTFYRLITIRLKPQVV